MPRPSDRPAKPTTCALCGERRLHRRSTTYPVQLTEPPSLAGKLIHVHRVALYECESCGHLMPTAAGKAKVERCVARGIEFFLRLIP
jgi:hypothetical protein